MQEFLSLLSLYYLCDAAAAVRPMNAAEIAACSATYEEVKVWFAPSFDLAAPGTPERHAQLLEGYLAFIAWQEANSALVSEMRAEALHQITEGDA